MPPSSENPGGELVVRKYQPGEERALWQLFHDTIHTVNARDYTLEQLQAWAPDVVDEASWRSRIHGMQPFVGVHNGVIVGYAGLLARGHVDHFYVHHQWQGRGVGRRLMAAVEAEAYAQRMAELSSDVSITARPSVPGASRISIVAPRQPFVPTIPSGA